jgi:hypothetical protein
MIGQHAADVVAAQRVDAYFRRPAIPTPVWFQAGLGPEFFSQEFRLGAFHPFCEPRCALAGGWLLAGVPAGATQHGSSTSTIPPGCPLRRLGRRRSAACT